MDIRLVRGRNHRVWLWIGGLVGLSLVLLGGAMLFGDATEGRATQVGADANFGAERAPVVPVVTEEFGEVRELEDRELGRVLHLSGWAESPARANALWVRSADGRRILVRFEPDPPEGALRRFTPGAGVSVSGYLTKISRVEFDVWMDTLGVRLPRPKPGVKFGDLPDSNFARVDSLFVKDYYISVRPEGIQASRPAPPPAPAAAPATGVRPAAPRRDTAAAPAPALAPAEPVQAGTDTGAANAPNDTLRL
ncbi:MAG TPA: hypothetical protein VHG91_06810 [Longimicrobium sp.]|nr:hypothetical protein [Longimicrobium sp.]